jgi:hypothetical protein
MTRTRAVRVYGYRCHEHPWLPCWKPGDLVPPYTSHHHKPDDSGERDFFCDGLMSKDPRRPKEVGRP